jgi:hypothetical protein
MTRKLNRRQRARRADMVAGLFLASLGVSVLLGGLLAIKLRWEMQHRCAYSASLCR